MNKKQHALTVYNQSVASGVTKRALICAALMSQVGISMACASTYHSNMKRGVWTLENIDSTVDVVEQVTAPALDLESMSNKQLVELYNKTAAKHVVKFRDHATAVKRVQQLLETA